MTVKELIEILKTCDQDSTITISVESNRSSSGSDEVSVSDGVGYVTLFGDETFYD
jgi:hypothetical protein